jgi:hypothetical protein
MENNTPALATSAEIIAFLATTKREVKIAKEETPLEKILAGMTSFNYEKEEGMLRVENVTFRHVAISAKTGKEYATFKTSDGKYKSFFTAQIQF